MTQRWSCALNGCSHPLNGSHVHNGCSGGVPTHSLVFMHTQQVFRGCSILIHWHSRALTSVQEVFNMCSAYSCTWRPNEYVFKFTKWAKGRITLLSISIWMTISLALPSKKTWGYTSWLVGGLGVHQWDWQQKIRKYILDMAEPAQHRNHYESTSHLKLHN